MKKGFQIEIQEDLNEQELVKAKHHADQFIIRTLQHPDKRFGAVNSHGGRDTPYSRGSCLHLGNDLYFLRINRHKRIFGVVRGDRMYGEEYGKMKVKKTPTKTYAIVGDIKG